MNNLHFLGAAFLVVWTLVLLYAWRVGLRCRELEQRIAELERALPESN